MLNPMYPRIGLAACLSSGYTGSHLNEPTRAASLTQTAPVRWVSFPTAQVVSSPPTCTCQGGHAKSERRRGAPLLRTATPPRQCRTCITGRLFCVGARALWSCVSPFSLPCSSQSRAETRRMRHCTQRQQRLPGANALYGSATTLAGGIEKTEGATSTAGATCERRRDGRSKGGPMNHEAIVILVQQPIKSVSTPPVPAGEMAGAAGQWQIIV
jgi:hypothetical protein